MIVEYQNIINLLGNTINEPSNFRTKVWVEINDDSCRMYSQIKFKTSMLISSLYDYSDVYILVKGTIAITGAGADDAAKQIDQRK